MQQTHLMSTYPAFKAKLVRGKGAHLYDDEGNDYLDFLSGIAVASLGHANEEIAAAGSRQLHELVHVSNYFENEFTQRVATKIDNKISQTLTKKGGRVFFANSGAEANECAIKVAKKYGQGKRYKFLTANRSFHGRTLATLAATGQPEKHEPFRPLPDYFSHFEFGNIDSLKSELTDEHIAVIIEVIQGEGGVNVASQEFFTALGQLCAEKNLLLIVDEIQTGMCRTGAWFGFEHYGLAPDIVTLAKGLGNGMPVGACWARESVAESFGVGDHGSTFGGQPLALSIVDTVFSIMERDNMPERVSRLGAVLAQSLREMELFTQVRGSGLLIGVDLDVDAVGCDAGDYAQRCFENGLIVNPIGERTIRFAPPFIIDENDIARAIEILRASCVGGAQ